MYNKNVRNSNQIHPNAWQQEHHSASVDDNNNINRYITTVPTELAATSNSLRLSRRRPHQHHPPQHRRYPSGGSDAATTVTFPTEASFLCNDEQQQPQQSELVSCSAVDLSELSKLQPYSPLSAQNSFELHHAGYYGTLNRDLSNNATTIATFVDVSGKTQVIYRDRKMSTQTTDISETRQPSATSSLPRASIANITRTLVNIESSLNRLNDDTATNVAPPPPPSLVPASPTATSSLQRAAILARMLTSCMDPLMFTRATNTSTIVNKSRQPELELTSPTTALASFESSTEIPFDAIRQLEWRGAGAQGAVFVGTLHGQRVAIKKVCTRREVEDVRPFCALEHHNIIRLIGVCTQELCYSIVMDYCENGSLYDHIQRGNAIMPSKLLSWTRQIAAGMQYLHVNKIVHRDLKSPNVLLDENYTLKISDFGTSKFNTGGSSGEGGETSASPTINSNKQQQKSLSLVGTVSWMAPEVIRSEPQNEKVDTWAFGVIVWEMLVGMPPYPGVDDAAAIMWGVGSEVLSLPIPDNVPQGLRLLMLQCWAAKPRNRPTFKNIQIHLDIAAPDVLDLHTAADDEYCEEYVERQRRWQQQVYEMLHKDVTDSALKHSPKVLKAQELAIFEQRKKELRHAQDIRMHYERKLERANNLYLEMTTCMLQLEQREREILKREQRVVLLLNSKDGRSTNSRRIVTAATNVHNSNVAASTITRTQHFPSLSANTTPLAHKLQMEREYSAGASNTNTTNSNAKSASLDRTTTLSASSKSSSRTTVAPGSVRQQIVPSPTQNPATNVTAPATALDDDRPFRRSKRAIRGSNSSSNSAASSASKNQPDNMFRRRRRLKTMTMPPILQHNKEEEHAAAAAATMPSTSTTTTSETKISPDLFKGLPRRGTTTSVVIAIPLPADNASIVPNDNLSSTDGEEDDDGVEENEDDDNLSDCEHQVSAMRQRLSNVQVQPSSVPSSSSSSSAEESSTASDATVSLSGPSVVALTSPA